MLLFYLVDIFCEEPVRYLNALSGQEIALMRHKDSGWLTFWHSVGMRMCATTFMNSN